MSHSNCHTHPHSGDTRAVGSIELTPRSIAKASTAPGALPSEIEVISGKRVYRVRGFDVADRDAWLEQIQAWVARLPEQQNSARPRSERVVEVQTKPSRVEDVEWLIGLLGIGADDDADHSDQAAEAGSRQRALYELANAALAALRPVGDDRGALASAAPEAVARCRFADGGGAFFALVAARMAEAQSLERRMVQVTTKSKEAGAFMSFGTADDFSGGLQRMIGLPKGLNEDHWTKQMRSE
eukprot:SAG11_NODE_10058_length_860_cov_1.245729_1_plen_240_part_10